MKSILTAIILLFITTNIMAQKQKTFIYEITLFEQFRNSINWSEKEKNIQQEHIVYLDSLTKNGKIEIAGIVDQSLENQTGIIILSVDNYEQAKEIVLNDPSIKKGMMSARLKPINIYFRKEQ
ncbi:MAG: YciI family protein [Melioribacteraceae bacterium]|nr:YciI family protein [Melioribacteraceae bacterium]